jgi:hypothetical protein
MLSNANLGETLPQMLESRRIDCGLLSSLPQPHCSHNVLAGV